MGKTGFPPTIIFFLCKIPGNLAVARPSIRSGTIVRVRLKFVLNKHWNQYFYYANFTSAIGFYENFKVTLTMVPNRFENCATAHLITFQQRKQMIAGGKLFSADSSTLTCVVYMQNHRIKSSQNYVFSGHRTFSMLFQTMQCLSIPRDDGTGDETDLSVCWERSYQFFFLYGSTRN